MVIEALNERQVEAAAPLPPTPEIILKAENLRKSFGNIRAVDDLSFSIYKGQVVGFIGANGAGKTTTMRILATLETADSGRIEILGYEATNYPDVIRPKLGWMPDNYGTYSNVTVEDYLDFTRGLTAFAEMCGVSGWRKSWPLPI